MYNSIQEREREREREREKEQSGKKGRYPNKNGVFITTYPNVSQVYLHTTPWYIGYKQKARGCVLYIRVCIIPCDVYYIHTHGLHIMYYNAL